MVAILAFDPGATELEDRLDGDLDRLCSPVSMWETTAALFRSYKVQLETSREIVARFVERFRIRCVPIGEREAQLAIDAHADYGKGRHPTALNMGDCFAYACAKANRASLLYTGQDFAKTDLA